MLLAATLSSVRRVRVRDELCGTTTSRPDSAPSSHRVLTLPRHSGSAQPPGQSQPHDQKHSGQPAADQPLQDRPSHGYRTGWQTRLVCRQASRRLVCGISRPITARHLPSRFSGVDDHAETVETAAAG